MAWEPKDPWGGSGQDPLDEVVRKAQDQLSRMVPGKGMKSIGLIVVAVLALWQS
ncbi:MAG: protease modulator HflK N-terminal domain-containing protein, partial [Nitrospira sp.]|nr:protease modulator HflK N-terminal domain-containing protein [Nitrospira sp.]